MFYDVWQGRTDTSCEHINVIASLWYKRAPGKRIIADCEECGRINVNKGQFTATSRSTYVDSLCPTVQGHH